MTTIHPLSRPESLTLLTTLRQWCEAQGFVTRDAQVMDPITGEFEVNTGRTTCVFRQCSAGFTWRQTGQPILVTGKMWGFRDRAFEQRIDAALPAKVWWADYAFDLLL